MQGNAERDADREADRLAAERDLAAEVIQRRLDKLQRSMHARYRAATIADLAGVQVEVLVGKEYRPAGLTETLTRWLARPGGEPSTLFLVGDTGLGKTHAAAATAHRAVLTEPVAWWSVAALLDALRPDSGTAAERERIWSEARYHSTLVLDDLAHTRPTEWAVERMWMLADARAGNNCSTIVTTNATFTDLEAAWGRATMDRLRAGVAVARFAGKSKRTPLW